MRWTRARLAAWCSIGLVYADNVTFACCAVGTYLFTRDEMLGILSEAHEGMCWNAVSLWGWDSRQAERDPVLALDRAVLDVAHRKGRVITGRYCLKGFDTR